VPVCFGIGASPRWAAAAPGISGAVGENNFVLALAWRPSARAAQQRKNKLNLDISLF